MNNTTPKMKENNSEILAQILEQHNKQMLCMLDVLEEEHQALSSSDIDCFERAVKNKQDQIKTFEQLQSQLSILEPILNGKFSKENIESYIGKIPPSNKKTRLERLWEKLEQTTIECNNKNIINNRIVDASSTHLRQAICILRGDLTGPAVNIYGASGKQNNTSLGHSLATA